MTCEHEYEFAERLTKLEARCSSNTKRLNKLEELTEVVHELASTMKLMAEKQMQTAETVDRLDLKITTIEQRPAKRWDGIVEKALMTVVAAVVGFILATVGIG